MRRKSHPNNMDDFLADAYSGLPTNKSISYDEIYNKDNCDVDVSCDRVDLTFYICRHLEGIEISAICVATTVTTIVNI